jgi:hypothetical protein
MSESDYSQEFSPNPPVKKKANTHRGKLDQKQNLAPNKKKSDGGLITIEDIESTETRQKINSPRSLEACKLEGVFPKELIHLPKSKFNDPGLPAEVADLRYEFHENKRKELIELVKKARNKIIDDLERSSYDHPTLAGSTQFQTTNGKFMSGRSVHTSKSARSRLSMKSSVLVGGAMDKDKEVTQKQMEIIKRIKEKEQSRFEKYLINEERKNKLLEEKEARFEHIRKVEQHRNEQIKHALKEENEKKMSEEIQREKSEQRREKMEKKQAWENFLANLEVQKREEVKAEKERLRKERELKKKEQLRLEKVKRCEEAQQEQMLENEKKLKMMNEKYREQMKTMKQYQKERKKQAAERAAEKRKKIHQIMKAKEEKEQRDLAKFLNKQQSDFEREMQLKKEK